MHGRDNVVISSDDRTSESSAEKNSAKRSCASEQAMTRRGGWSMKCKRLVKLVLEKDWNAALDLAAEYNCEGFMHGQTVHE